MNSEYAALFPSKDPQVMVSGCVSVWLNTYQATLSDLRKWLRTVDELGFTDAHPLSECNVLIDSFHRPADPVDGGVFFQVGEPGDPWKPEVSS